MTLHEPENTAFQQMVTVPLRVVIVGGTSVGKTTLANAWSHSNAPTGLGGQTQQVREIRYGDRLILDTPSLDEGFDILRVAQGCDVLVWIVDGLRPISQTETNRIAAVRPLVGDCIAIVSRADLLPTTEYTQVMKRCAELFDGTTTPADLRRAPPAFPHVDPLRTRVRALTSFLNACLEPLNAAQASVDQWREHCRGPLTDSLDVVLQRIAASTVSMGLPPLPPLPAAPVTHDISSRAQWCMDGELILTDWLGPLGSPLERQERCRALEQMLNRLQGLPPTALA